MLVTERPGRLRIVRATASCLPRSPACRRCAHGQGGLHDVVARSRVRGQQDDLFLLRRAGLRRRTHRDGARQLNDGDAPKLDDVKVIFRQEGPLSSGNHYGCRIVQGRDGNLLLTMGDHFSQRDEAQNLANHIGKIVRVTPDGAVPPDNPFVNRKDAKPEIWSYGHRNSQGAALHPQTGKLWEHEHGPRGGDEINIPLAGKNYGWPVIGYGIDYSGAKIHEATEKAGMEQPVKYWVPSIAPSGMAFYTGDLFAGLEGQPVRRRARRTVAGAARARRREGRQGGAPAGQPARAHPRRAAGPGRRALAARPTAATAGCCASRRRNDPASAEVM